jgi:phosphoribosylaminoimidazole (AIR) synthetase
VLQIDKIRHVTVGINSLFFFKYFQSGFSQDEMFEYFNCGIDYLIIIDHTKSSIENILQQLTQTHTSCFLLGTFTSTSKYFKMRLELL